MPYTIRHNARTAHLEHTTDYAQTGCAALTRSGHRMAAADEVDTLADALEALHYFAEVRGLKVCANCDRAAIADLESAYDIAELEARSAYGQVEAATTTGNEHRIAELEARAERAADKYADLAAAIARCNIIGCEKDTEPGDSQCLAHIREHGRAIDYLEGHDARTCRHRTSGEPCTACALLAADLEAARVAYRAAINDADGSHDRVSLALADAMLRNYQQAARDAAACLYYGCAAVVDDGSGWCPEHGPKTHPNIAERAEPAADNMARGCLDRITHNAIGAACIRTGEHNTHRTATGIEWMSGKTRPTRCPADYCQDCEDHAAALVARVEAENTTRTVTACLDHTEPGHAVAIITGGHGREDAPQAWLAHEGGSWLLVDDYDGDTLNVKGPDPERAVYAWAALLGLRIDALTVEVEYAGGPVSPPVREPERPVADTLEWVWMSNDGGTNVFEAHGRAHEYRVTEHADAAGASLVGTLRNTEVVTYRRGYMTGADARKAAEHYEARYGSAYVPVA